jgi:hypothetical protein
MSWVGPGLREPGLLPFHREAFSAPDDDATTIPPSIHSTRPSLLHITSLQEDKATGTSPCVRARESTTILRRPPTPPHPESHRMRTEADSWRPLHSESHPTRHEAECWRAMCGHLLHVARQQDADMRFVAAPALHPRAPTGCGSLQSGPLTATTARYNLRHRKRRACLSVSLGGEDDDGDEDDDDDTVEVQGVLAFGEGDRADLKRARRLKA